MSTARWVRSLVQGNPELYRQIYDWNTYPHRWALPAWLEGATAPAPVVTLLEKSPRGRARLSRHYCTALGLNDTFWDFEAPQRRLALLPASALTRLAQFAGAALHWSGLSRIVTKQGHQDVAATIGRDAYAFALRRGRLLTTTAGLTASTHAVIGPDATLPQAGWKVIAASLAAEPPVILHRFRLKAPRELELGNPSPTDPTPAQAWTYLQPIIADTLTTEERRCFA